MAVKVAIISDGISMKEKVNRLFRCSECEFLHENGNCLKVGGFFTSVKDKDCPKLKEKEENK